MQRTVRWTKINRVAIVSIPIGFSNELQLHRSGRGRSRAWRFQSLSGFPMSCNAGVLISTHPASSFQSLSGFPMSCNPHHPTRRSSHEGFQSLSGFPMSCNGGEPGSRHRAKAVSIPIGFSNELQQTAPGRLRGSRPSFNPYRVFQ